MNILSGVKRLAETLVLLSFVSFTASPITSMLGIEQPPVNDALGIVKFAMITGVVIIVVAIGAVLGFGYLILTAWKGHRRIPRSIKLLLSFALGALAFSLSGPISMVLPLPMLPTVLTTILLWGSLRAISGALPNMEPNTIGMPDAIASARILVKQLEPNTDNIEVLASKCNGKSWKVSLLSGQSRKKYEMEIDAQTGGAIKWKIN